MIQNWVKFFDKCAQTTDEQSVIAQRYIDLMANNKLKMNVQINHNTMVKTTYIVFLHSLSSKVKACYANTGHVFWMRLHITSQHTTDQ